MAKLSIFIIANRVLSYKSGFIFILWICQYIIDNKFNYLSNIISTVSLVTWTNALVSSTFANIS